MKNKFILQLSVYRLIFVSNLDQLKVSHNKRKNKFINEAQLDFQHHFTANIWFKFNSTTINMV